MSITLYDALPSVLPYSRNFHDRPKRPINRLRKFAILTSEDTRLNPAKFAILNEFHAHVVYNAGGRASEEAIRSLAMSHELFGTHEWLIVHQSDRGMATTNDRLAACHLVMDVQRTRSHPLVPSSVSISGYIFDVRTGMLRPVQGAVSPGMRIASPFRPKTSAIGIA